MQSRKSCGLPGDPNRPRAAVLTPPPPSPRGSLLHFSPLPSHQRPPPGGQNFPELSGPRRPRPGLQDCSQCKRGTGRGASRGGAAWPSPVSLLFPAFPGLGFPGDPVRRPVPHPHSQRPLRSFIGAWGGGTGGCPKRPTLLAPRADLARGPAVPWAWASLQPCDPPARREPPNPADPESDSARKPTWAPNRKSPRPCCRKPGRCPVKAPPCPVAARTASGRSGYLRWR